VVLSNPTRIVQPNIGNPRAAFDPQTGRNFALEDCGWIDTKTLQPAPSAVVLTNPTRIVQPNIGNPKAAFDPQTGRNFALEPCPSKGAAQTTTPQVGMLGDGTLGGIKISENNSPMPTDRVYLTFNHFTDGSFEINRETFGFEKTFLDGQASIGLRLPFEQDSFGSDVGDLSIIAKYAFLNAPSQGAVVSGGLAVALPVNSPGGSAIVQPFVGWTLSPILDNTVVSPFGTLLFQGFHSIIIPMNGSGDAIAANSLSAGVSLGAVNGTAITGVVPTVELHLNSPLNRLDDSNLNATFGAQIEIANGPWIGLGVAMPVSGPKPFDTEAIATLSLRF
jgi:hypothetical protein